MNWNELLETGIIVEEIPKDSDQYHIMYNAAAKGNPSAQYYLGLWRENVQNKPKAAMLWYRKAAQQNYVEAIEALKRLDVEEDSVEVENISKPVEPDERPASLVVQDREFQQAKNSLLQYTEQIKKDVKIKTVPTKGGFLKLFSHTVTGSELNEVTCQIEHHLININTLNQGVLEQLKQIYKAFDALDKGCIAGIVGAINAAAEVRKHEQEDRENIKKLLKQQDDSLFILKAFKKKLDELNHILDVDKLWDLVDEQANLLNEFSEYIGGLSQIAHLNEVDALYSDAEVLKKDVIDLAERFSGYAEEFKSVHAYCDKLSRVQHLEDVDDLWERTESVSEEIKTIKADIENQVQRFSAVCEEIRKQMKGAADAQTAQLERIEQHCSESIETLSKEQAVKFDTMEKAFIASLDTAVKEQTIVMEKFASEQEEKIKELSEQQAANLEKMATDQADALDEMNRSLNEEKAQLNEQIGVLAKRVKLSYYVAGGAAAFAIIQLLLSIVGVI